MPRRKAEDAAKTRRAIVASARALFIERGFAAAATTEVAARAGVTRGALYHHFVDKTDLFRAVFVDLEQELNDTVLATAMAQPDARSAFLAGSRAAMQFMTRPDYRQIATVDAPAVLGHDEWHALDAAIGLASMEAGLAAMHADGHLEQPPDRALAIVLFGALTEAGLAAARGDGALDDLFAAFRDLVDRLAPRPAPAGAAVAPPVRT